MIVRRFNRTCLYVTSLTVLTLVALLPAQAHALLLTQRSITLDTPVSGATTTHRFGFTYASTSTVGSVAFEYCDSPLVDMACVAPPGVNVSGVALSQQQGETGFSISSASNNVITLTRSPSAASNTASAYTFTNAVNMTGAPGTFYIRISTFATADASGPYTDFGAVVASTTQGVAINSEVPPILNFCVGQSIPGGCSTAEGDVVDLGVLSDNSPATGTSQMLAATNAPFGLAITANGTTMTSGNNVITALNSPTPSAPGNAQFGLNLRSNSSPPVGREPEGPGVANPTAQYNIPNRFVFHPGDVVATTPGTTNNRKFTVSYLTNVPPGQPPGVYTATLTYICTASF